MKFSTVLFTSLACASTASAQYFSEGWQPGQPIPDVNESPPTPSHHPSQHAPPHTGGSLFDVSRILECGPVSGLFNKIGVNISKHLEEARMQTEKLWDRRIPLITDDNYDEIIVKEELTPEEEEKRLWFVVITAQAGQQGGMSKFLDDNFDTAYNESIIEGDLPDVRWARIDYFNVTYLTTKWNIWQAPYVMVIRDRGQTLYFYKANQVRLTPEVIREFLKTETWKNSVAWKTPFSPGGDYERYMHYYALATQKIYNLIVVLPRWLVMILSGIVASFAMRLMHRNPAAEVAVSREEERKLKSQQRRANEAASKVDGAVGEGVSNVETKSAPSKNGERVEGVSGKTTGASPGKVKVGAKARKSKK
ncbi:unnamed protein product [Somion occarium]|uniref:Thioredoxin-like fold domain-containing protein n=1 Tax=Somion occarium TaxID=3059160 RepID=A0ABP1CX88_9APHY